MKVLIADKLSEKTVSALEDLGAEVLVKPELTADELPKALDDIEILIVRSTRVETSAIKAAPFLSLIIRAGAGVNTIDVETASSSGIHVSNCPGKNSDAVAELALGLLIAADRRIVGATNKLRSGKWNKKEYGKSRGLKGKALGIIGFGRIGKAVARCGKGLGMNVIAWSQSLTKEKAEELDIGYCECPEKVAEQADAISVHLVAKSETKHFIGKDFLNRMKNGAILINTSRGEVVDTAALKEAIKEKELRVGLDVFENEPSGGEDSFEDTELAGIVSCTPHIGASTDQASEAIAEEVIQIVKTYKEVGKSLNIVNLRQKSSAKINLVVRHYNCIGVLAGVLDELRNEGINIEEMENSIFEGGVAASCILRLDSVPSDNLINKIKNNENIIQVMLK